MTIPKQNRPCSHSQSQSQRRRWKVGLDFIELLITKWRSTSGVCCEGVANFGEGGDGGSVADLVARRDFY